MRYVYQNTSVQHDNETHAMFMASERLTGEERDRMIRLAHERISMIEAGLKRVPEYIQTAIQTFCAELRVRYCFERDKLVIEHFHPQTNWQIIGGGEWRNHDNGQPYSPEAMIAMLRAGDMQQKGTAKYLEEKKNNAIAVQRSNDSAHTRKVNAAVDSLSTKQVKQFIDVQNAIRSGETVVPLGDDAKFLEKVHTTSKKEAARLGKSLKKAARNDDMAAMNPGQHPLIYKK